MEYVDIQRINVGKCVKYRSGLSQECSPVLQKHDVPCTVYTTVLH